jgi:hypothetical protein
MSFRPFLPVSLSIFLLAATVPLATPQNPPAPAAKPPEKTDQTSHVTIEVSGGDDNTPVENASIYVKYVEERKIRKDKTVELNVKTSRDGVAHIQSAPLGRVLIQVVADGWKTYGRWYDITDAKQTFKVHLDKPPKWY